MKILPVQNTKTSYELREYPIEEIDEKSGKKKIKMQDYFNYLMKPYHDRLIDINNRGLDNNDRDEMMSLMNHLDCDQIYLIHGRLKEKDAMTRRHYVLIDPNKENVFIITPFERPIT